MGDEDRIGGKRVCYVEMFIKFCFIIGNFAIMNNGCSDYDIRLVGGWGLEEFWKSGFKK